MSPVMNNFWLSWYHPKSLGDFELHSPWWINGSRLIDDSATICAAVQAPDLNAAKETIKASFTKKPNDLEWRFAESRDDSWSPFSDRFPRRDWMVWRRFDIERASTSAEYTTDGRFTVNKGD